MRKLKVENTVTQEFVEPKIREAMLSVFDTDLAERMTVVFVLLYHFFRKAGVLDERQGAIAHRADRHAVGQRLQSAVGNADDFVAVAGTDETVGIEGVAAGAHRINREGDIALPMVVVGEEGKGGL